MHWFGLFDFIVLWLVVYLSLAFVWYCLLVFLANSFRGRVPYNDGETICYTDKWGNWHYLWWPPVKNRIVMKRREKMTWYNKYIFYP